VNSQKSTGRGSLAEYSYSKELIISSKSPDKKRITTVSRPIVNPLWAFVVEKK